MQKLIEAVETIGKPSWRAMLRYVAQLHEKSINPPRAPFTASWEEIGPGYCYAPAFGHWDIVHAICDVLAWEPEHARQQLMNDLGTQQADGMFPGVLWMRPGNPTWSTTVTHPPVWPFAGADYARLHGNEIIEQCYEPLLRQIAWFERHRKADGEGFFYCDILNNQWESGVDEGIRFLGAQTGPHACVDATAHVYALYDFAAAWSKALGRDGGPFAAEAVRLQKFIQERLFSEETGFFHDSWAVQDARQRCLAFEGVWPLVVGAATPCQARRVVEENLLNPRRFFSAHPITTVSMDDPRFELRMWRGPAWNSMTYWAGRGCRRYGLNQAAAVLLEKALDDSAAQFARSGTIWEFYHPHGGHPEDVQRKPDTEFNTPSRDYLGHNPLIAMAALYDAARRDD